MNGSRLSYLLYIYLFHSLAGRDIVLVIPTNQSQNLINTWHTYPKTSLLGSLMNRSLMSIGKFSIRIHVTSESKHKFMILSSDKIGLADVTWLLRQQVSVLGRKKSRMFMES